MIYHTSASQHIVLINKLINVTYYLDFSPIIISACVMGVYLSLF